MGEGGREGGLQRDMGRGRRCKRSRVVWAADPVSQDRPVMPEPRSLEESRTPAVAPAAATAVVDFVAARALLVALGCWR